MKKASVDPVGSAGLLANGWLRVVCLRPNRKRGQQDCSTHRGIECVPKIRFHGVLRFYNVGIALDLSYYFRRFPMQMKMRHKTCFHSSYRRCKHSIFRLGVERCVQQRRMRFSGQGDESGRPESKTRVNVPLLRAKKVAFS